MKYELVSLLSLTFSAAVALSEQVSSPSASSASCQSCQHDHHPAASVKDRVAAEAPTHQREQIVFQQNDVQTMSSNTTARASNDPSPWSYNPVCTGYFDVLDGPLCVYTNSSFSSGRGISIFTTPKIASEFAALLPFHDDSILSQHGINPVAAAADNDGQSPWYTKPLEGKGIGMLASRPLKRGDLVAAYTPFLLAHMENLLSTVERERFLRVAVDQLPAASRERYFSLATIYDDPRVVVQDVVKANAFEMQVGGQMHLAVFPEASRMNHACGPNSQYYLEPNLLTHFVHAARDVAQDEELTISYSPPLRFHQQRQEYLRSTFHFNCTCWRCSRPEQGDQAVHDILALQWALGNWEANSTASVRKAEMLVRLFRQEALDAFLDTAYGHAAFTYNAVGSARGAVKYAKLAAEAALLKYGPAANLDDWKQMMRDPQRHSSWRRRKND